MSIVRHNMLNELGYAPYCLADKCTGFGKWPRMKFNGEQMQCPNCGHTTKFEPEFIEQYKAAQENLRKAAGQNT